MGNVKLNGMASQKWFIHIQNEAIGPLTTETVLTMLRQYRLHFTDFAWTAGLSRWVRLSEIDAFVPHLPPYPKSAIPQVRDEKSQEVRHSYVYNDDEEKHSEAEESEEAPEEPSRLSLPFLRKSKAAAKPEPKAEPKREAKHEPVEDDAEDTALKTQARDVLKQKVIRKFVRIPIDAAVEIEGHGRYKAVDVGEGGIFVRAKEPLPIGTPVKFSIDSKAFPKKLDMTGVVIRSGQANSTDGFARVSVVPGDGTG